MITVGGTMGPVIPVRWDLGAISQAIPQLTDDEDVLEYLLAIEGVHISILAASVRRK